MKYLGICKPLYKERGNAVSGLLDDNIERIHKEGRGEKSEEGYKSVYGGDFNAGGEVEGVGRIHGGRLRLRQDLRRHRLWIEYYY